MVLPKSQWLTFFDIFKILGQEPCPRIIQSTFKKCGLIPLDSTPVIKKIELY